MKNFTQALLFLLSAFLVNCGAGPQAKSTSGSGGGGSGEPITECVDNNCFQAKPQKIEAVMTHRQIMPSFQKCLNLTDAQISAAAKTAFAESLNTFSLNGAAKDLSAPMMMALMTVSSEMCLSRINVEATMTTGRIYFPGFTLSTGAGSVNNTQTYNLNKTIEDLAKSCWGRAIKPAELSLINKHIGGQRTRSAALYACSAVLSSTQAVRF